MASDHPLPPVGALPIKTPVGASPVFTTFQKTDAQFDDDALVRQTDVWLVATTVLDTAAVCLLSGRPLAAGTVVYAPLLLLDADNWRVAFACHDDYRLFATHAAYYFDEPALSAWIRTAQHTGAVCPLTLGTGHTAVLYSHDASAGQTNDDIYRVWRYSQRPLRLEAARNALDFSSEESTRAAGVPAPDELALLARYDLSGDELAHFHRDGTAVWPLAPENEEDAERWCDGIVDALSQVPRRLDNEFDLRPTLHAYEQHAQQPTRERLEQLHYRLPYGRVSERGSFIDGPSLHCASAYAIRSHPRLVARCLQLSASLQGVAVVSPLCSLEPVCVQLTGTRALIDAATSVQSFLTGVRLSSALPPLQCMVAVHGTCAVWYAVDSARPDSEQRVRAQRYFADQSASERPHSVRVNGISGAEITLAPDDIDVAVTLALLRKHRDAALSAGITVRWQHGDASLELAFVCRQAYAGEALVWDSRLLQANLPMTSALFEPSGVCIALPVTYYARNGAESEQQRRQLRASAAAVARTEHRAHVDLLTRAGTDPLLVDRARAYHSGKLPSVDTGGAPLCALPRRTAGQAALIELLRLGDLAPPVAPYTMDSSTLDVGASELDTRLALDALGLTDVPEHGVPWREHDPREQHALYGRVYVPTQLSRLARALIGLDEWPRAAVHSSTTVTTTASSSPSGRGAGARKAQRTLPGSGLSLLLEDSSDGDDSDDGVRWQDSDQGDYQL
jgi:hypothetical protein